MKYEYKKLDLNSAGRREDDIDILNHWGEEGWKLMWISPAYIGYMMRETAPEPRPKRAYTRRTVQENVPA